MGKRRRRVTLKQRQAWVSRELKDAVWQRAGGKCERCGATVSRRNWEAHVHHLVYRKAPEALLGDLLLLCLICHGKIHPHHEFLTRVEQVQRARRTPRRRGMKAWAQDATAARKVLARERARVGNPLRHIPKAERKGLRRDGAWAWRDAHAADATSDLRERIVNGDYFDRSGYLEGKE